MDHLVWVSHDEHTVLRLTVANPGDDRREGGMVTARGRALFGAAPGEHLRITGTWTIHPRYGRQLKADRSARTPPSTLPAMRRYLASPRIKGIGATLAAAIVDTFGAQTLTVIDTDPARLTQVPGIGPTRLRTITEAWQTNKDLADLMVFLQGLDIPASLATKIHRTYTDRGLDPLQVVTTTPYELIQDIPGIGFRSADRIALKTGTPKHSDERLQAAMYHVLTEAHGKQGHCHLPTTTLLARTHALVHDPADPATTALLPDRHSPPLRHALDALRARRDVVIEKLPLPGDPVLTGRGIVSLTRMQRAEAAVAAGITRLTHAPSTVAARADWTACLAEHNATSATQLTATQQQAVLIALTAPVSILTGGPGCGKTHTMRTLVAVGGAGGLTIALAAPTGKAAKRLEESAGHPATTVHRLLRPIPSGDSPPYPKPPIASADLIVIDEASILDIHLAADLTSAVRSGRHLLLVGDTDQLPSIGPGRVLRDLLAVPTIPRTRLTEVFRHDQNSSAIAENAHRILTGHPPHPARGTFGLIHLEDPEHVAAKIVDLATRDIPHHFGAHPADIQVLCPTRRHTVGTLDLNARLQHALNPPAPDRPETYHDGRIYRLGDRVLHTRNQPRRGAHGIFNGTTGTITGIDHDATQLTVTTDDGEPVTYDYAELDELLHAHALTVHRAQGSEYPYVLIPLVTSAGIKLLQRSLLYTAVTRACTAAVIVGQRAALRIALANSDAGARHTALAHRLLHHDPLAPSEQHRANQADQLTCF